MNQYDARLVSQNAVAAFMRANLNITDAVLAQSTLRLEQAAQTTSSNYNFPVPCTDTSTDNPFNTEVRLVRQDAFLISEIGFFLSEPISASDTNFVPYTYPDALLFSTTGESAALNTVYNGNLSILVNGARIMSNWDMMRYYNAPQTQNKVGATINANLPIAQRNGNWDGFAVVEPNIVIAGNNHVVFNLKLPASISIIGSFTRLIFILRGIRAQNVTFKK